MLKQYRCRLLIVGLGIIPVILGGTWPSNAGHAHQQARDSGDVKLQLLTVDDEVPPVENRQFRMNDLIWVDVLATNSTTKPIFLNQSKLLIHFLPTLLRDGKTTPYCATMQKRLAYSAPPTAVRLKGVQLEVSVSKDRFNKSEPINLNLVVSNDSKREIYIVESNVLRDYEIEVRDQRGLVVPISTEGKQLLERAQWVGRRVLFAIEPGTSRTHIFELSKIFEMGEPGIYTIKAKRKVFVKKGSQPIELSGKAVTVTLSA